MQQDRTLVKDVLREFRPYCPAAADIDKSVNSIPTRGQIMPITSQNPKTSPGMATRKYSNSINPDIVRIVNISASQ